MVLLDDEAEHVNELEEVLLVELVDKQETKLVEPDDDGFEVFLPPEEPIKYTDSLTHVTLEAIHVIEDEAEVAEVPNDTQFQGHHLLGEVLLQPHLGVALLEEVHAQHILINNIVGLRHAEVEVDDLREYVVVLRF